MHVLYVMNVEKIWTCNLREWIYLQIIIVTIVCLRAYGPSDACKHVAYITKLMETDTGEPNGRCERLYDGELPSSTPMIEMPR